MANVKALIDSASEVNAMIPVYVAKLELRTCHTKRQSLKN